MPRLIILPVSAAIIFLGWFWASGGFSELALWAAGEQRDFQNGIARTLRGLRAGNSGAFWALMAACFAYGFFHAIGPGHGKVLIGGYGAGRDVPWAKLTWISIASSLGQAVTAIAITYGGIYLFEAGRTALVGTTESVMAPISYGAISLIGLWLVYRGIRKFVKTGHDHAHHDHDHGACNHKHGPDVEDVESAGSIREIVALIAGIAIRPCTGALFILILTWQMGIPFAGIAGAFAMALGTASIVVAVGLAAVGLRAGFISSLSENKAVVWLIPTLELSAGLIIVVIAAGLLMRSIA